MPKTKQPRVAIYGRVSTGHQDVTMQISELRTVASQRGWKIVEEYIDEGVSGSTTARPGLDAMMQDARRGKLDCVMVWKLDRLGRSLQHLLSILDEFHDLGVKFVSVRDPGFDDSPSGKLMMVLISAFCMYEKAIIVERVKAGVQRAQMAGKHCGRPKSTVDLRPIKALQDQGHSIREIAAMLGISRGTVWRRLKDAEGAGLDDGDAIDGDAKVSSITASA